MPARTVPLPPADRAALSVALHRDAFAVDARAATILLQRLANGERMLSHIPPTHPDHAESLALWKRLAEELYALLRSAYGHFYLVRKVEGFAAVDLWNELMPATLPDYLPLARLLRYFGGRSEPPHWITDEDIRLLREASYPPETNVLDVGLEDFYGDEPPF